MQLVLVGSIERIHPRQEIVTALGAIRRLGSLSIGVKEQDVRDGRRIVGIIQFHRHRFSGQGVTTIHIGNADFHLVFAVGQRETLLPDKGSIEIARVGHHWTVKGDFRERGLLPFLERCDDLNRGLELPGLKLLIDRRTVFDGDGILHKGCHGWHTIGGRGEIGFQSLCFDLCVACKSNQH